MDIITLIERYVKDLVSAGQTFFDHPDRFHDFEKTVVDLSHRTAAQYMYNGRKKIIDLVQYRREREFLEQEKRRKATGTDGTIGGDTVRKILSIREQIANI